MPATFILAVAAMGLVLVVLAVAGTRQEPSAHELMSRQAPSLIARLARRLLGVYVRRPDPTVIPGKRRGEPSHTAQGPVRQPDGHA